MGVSEYSGHCSERCGVLWAVLWAFESTLGITLGVSEYSGQYSGRFREFWGLFWAFLSTLGLLWALLSTLGITLRVLWACLTLAHPYLQCAEPGFPRLGDAIRRLKTAFRGNRLRIWRDRDPNLPFPGSTSGGLS